MKGPAYYNENDPDAAAYLRNLIAAGHIAPGDVDERSIEDVRPIELVGYAQCHFFAGIGGWSYALRLAGWPDDKRVWTGSCPCQPFSSAGKREGFSDERHLWPAWFHLIKQFRPETVFGEQVASKGALTWLDLVFSDMEGEGYSVWATDLCAAGFGAPQIRQRLWFVAESEGGRKRTGLCGYKQTRRGGDVIADGSTACRLADADDFKTGEWGGPDGEKNKGVSCGAVSDGRSYISKLGIADNERLEGHAGHVVTEKGRTEQDRSIVETGFSCRPGPLNGQWRNADWLFCRDGKWRAVEPGTFPLAYGVSERMGRLRAYGNAVVPQVAAEIIKAYMSAGEI